MALLVCALVPLRAQFSLAGRAVQVHGFFSQGFLYSNQNNYLTMPTSRASFALTDGGTNISMRLTSRLRVGAQAYVRNVGELGNGRVTLDWASIDYSVNDHFGIRAGKVKTVLGLYNDTQDVEYLNTALLPQSLYPLDLRGLTISHIGGDVYGSFSPHGLGRFAYTVYGGKAPSDPTGGNRYALSSYGLNITGARGTIRGADLKWTPPIPNLQLGAGIPRTRPRPGGHEPNLRRATSHRLDSTRPGIFRAVHVARLAAGFRAYAAPGKQPRRKRLRIPPDR